MDACCCTNVYGRAIINTSSAYRCMQKNCKLAIFLHTVTLAYDNTSTAAHSHSCQWHLGCLGGGNTYIHTVMLNSQTVCKSLRALSTIMMLSSPSLLPLKTATYLTSSWLHISKWLCVGPNARFFSWLQFGAIEKSSVIPWGIWYFLKMSHFSPFECLLPCRENLKTGIIQREKKAFLLFSYITFTYNKRKKNEKVSENNCAYKSDQTKRKC